MIDEMDLLRDFLLTVPGLTALVDDRIYAGRNVPPPDYRPTTGPAVTFRTRGGEGDYEDALLNESLQFKCYGETAVEAHETYRALVDALNLACSANILHAELEVAGQQLEEPETLWPLTLAYFLVLFRQS